MAPTVTPLSALTSELTTAFFAHSQDLLLIVDVSGRFKEMSQSWERLLGHSRTDLIGRPLLDLVHPDDHVRTNAAREQLIRCGELTDFENRYVTKDGATIWLSWNARVLGDEHLCFAVAREVTAQKCSQATFDRVLEILFPLSGDVFLSKLVELFGRELGWDRVVLTQLQAKQSRLQTLKLWNKEGMSPSPDVVPIGASTEELLKERHVVVLRSAPNKRLDRSPHPSLPSEPPDFNSNFGETIRGSNDEPVGFIELFGRNRRNDVELEQRVLRVLASRIAAEIERREQESQLIDSRGRYQFLCDHASDMIHVHDLEGRWIFVNAALMNLLGYDPTDVIGKSPFRLIHPDDQEIVRSVQQAALRAPGVHSATCRVRTKSGAWRWLESRIQAIHEPGSQEPIEILAMTRDITIRKIEEEERRKIALRQMLHVQQTPLAVIEFTPTGEITAWNPSAEKIFGWTRDQILGKHFSVLLPEEELEPISALWDHLQSQRGGFRKTNANLRADGSKVICEWYNTPLVDADGTTIGIASLGHDITYRRKSEALIENQRLQMVAASKMSALGEMAAGIAHEINNPLAIIFGRVDQLRKIANQENMSPSRVIEIADNLTTTAERIARIVSGLRFFARDGARDAFEKRPLANLVDDTLEFCRSRFENHAVSLELLPPPTPVSLECRPVQISQVLLNLLNNSFDAIQDQEDRWVRVSWNETNVEASETEEIEIRITDSGLGIRADIAARIMTPFFTTKPLGRGTGLGLSISRGIVESHSGRLELDSKAPNTTFVIRLPRCQPSPADAPAANRQAGRPLEDSRQTNLDSHH